MSTTTVFTGEWAAVTLRPVAHWEARTGADGRTRLEMVWSVPDPAVHELHAVA